ncbi:MAG: aspartyl protease family protein [Draconibacterium sp.]|nr:aspartyl protease family protein [Draconibacterium sp.]
MKIKIPLHLIELEEDNFHLIVTTTFSDGTNGNWVIDTGASKTVFDKTLVGKYAILEDEPDEVHTIGIGESLLETSMALLNTVQLEKLKIGDMKVALLDLSHINELYSKAGNLKICGLIGGDFLMKYRAMIDYNKRLLILNS